MAFSELQVEQIERALTDFMNKRRPPEHIRDKLDLAYRVNGQSVEIFEIRPIYFKPEEKRESDFAKATFVKRSNTWKIYWMRASGKWEAYQPQPQVPNIEAFLDVVDQDIYGCFFG